MPEAERISLLPFIRQSQEQLVIDVRSPKEYAQAHIPGAVSVPIFSDEERVVIGTLYKQQSRALAIKAGLDFFGPKMRSIIETVEQLIVTNSRKDVPKSSILQDHSQLTVFIYCWRGGMRSAAMAWLLQLYGYKVKVLTGGYKSYRRWVIQTLELPFHFNILGGYTGSGKTEVLHELKKKGEIIIDLEGLANHKGSAFGKQGDQPSQEHFENLLAFHLAIANQAACRDAGDLLPPAGHPVKPIWIEDESQRIGCINIPLALWQTMRQAPVFFLDIPFEERLQYLTIEYARLDKEYLSTGIQRITKRLGGLAAKQALLYLEEDNLMECFRILLAYYDKSYGKGLNNRNDLSSLLTRIASDKVNTCNANLLSNYSVV